MRPVLARTGTIVLLGALGMPASAGDVPVFTPDLEHIPAGVSGYDGFGAAVAWFDDDTVVVGSPGDDAGGDEAGAIWVLDLDLVTGSPSVVSTTRVVGTDVDAQFGEDLAVVAGLLAVASPLEDDRRGSVRLFADDGDWVETQVLLGPGAESRFGACLDAAGDRLVVGAPGGDSPRVAIFDVVDGVGLVAGEISAPGGGQDDRFGAAVAVAADGRIAVGAPGFDEDRGRVLVYGQHSKGWMLEATLEGAADGDRFGESVRFCGDRLAVGLPGGNGGDAGGVLVFGVDLDPTEVISIGSHGYETGIVLAFDPASGLLGVGSTGSFYSGGVALHRIGDQIELVGELSPAVGSGQYELFGLGLSIRDGCVLAGAPFRESSAGPWAGACFLAGTGIDCDGDLLEDAWEIGAGLEEDCNGNGGLDPCDIVDGVSEDRDLDGVPDECQSIVVLEVPAPYATINAALDVARDGDRILVHPGTYTEAIDFGGRAIEIVSSQGAEVTTLDGTGLKEVSVVTAVSGETTGSILRGFTVSNGRSGTPFPFDDSIRVGGGLFAFFASPSIEDCRFVENDAAFGGGAYLYEWNGTMDGCAFLANDAAADGGGLQLSRCDGVVTGGVFEGNDAVRRGGAIHVFNGSPVLDSCRMSGNTCNSEGGGISFASFDGTPRLVGSQVLENTADVLGGGIFVDEDTNTPEIGTTEICGNLPQDIYGGFVDLGGNQVCFCAGDLNLDGEVGASDLGLLLANWNNGGNFPQADLDGDGEVGASDLGFLLSLFGPCLP